MDLVAGDRIAAFVPDFARVAYFTYVNTESKYKGLQLLNYELDKRLMLNETANPDNKRYHTEISGTGNLRSALQAPILASKGHYYQLSDVVSDQVAQIYDSNGNYMTPDPDRDETQMSIE